MHHVGVWVPGFSAIMTSSAHLLPHPCTSLAKSALPAFFSLPQSSLPSVHPCVTMPCECLPRSASVLENIIKCKECCHREEMPDTSGIAHPHGPFMERAIHLSRVAGLERRTGGCFGAVIVKNGEIVGEGYNNVVSRNDPTWHGEVGAIRDAAQRLGTPHLKGCVLYTSSEPCPMCMGACYWARIDKVYYATTAQDVKEHGNFEDEDFYLEFAKPPADRNIPAREFMRDEAIKVWEEFAQLPDRCHY